MSDLEQEYPMYVKMEPKAVRKVKLKIRRTKTVEEFIAKIKEEHEYDGHWVTMDEEEFKQLISLLESHRAALEKIASFKEGPVVNSSFDEPYSAEISRAELERKVR